MKDFYKEKIIYTITLLAVLFSMTPVIEAYGDSGYIFFGLLLSISICYYVTLGFLGLSVYIYSFNMLSDNPKLIIQKVGNILYVISLFIPLLYLLMWIITLIGNLSFVQSLVDESIFSVASFIASIIPIGLSIAEVSKKLIKRDKRRLSVELADNELKSIENATKLLTLELYSASVMEAFSGLEYSVKRAMSNLNITYDKKSVKLFDLAINVKLISEKYIDDISVIRGIRNKAAHPRVENEINKKDAEDVIRIVKKLLTELSKSYEQTSE